MSFESNCVYIATTASGDKFNIKFPPERFDTFDKVVFDSGGIRISCECYDMKGSKYYYEYDPVAGVEKMLNGILIPEKGIERSLKYFVTLEKQKGIFGK